MARGTTLKNLLAQAWADSVAEASMHDASPGTTGANEITGIDRVALTFPDPPTAGVILSDPGAFDVPASTSSTHVGLWDGSGNFLEAVANDVTFTVDTTYNVTVRHTEP